MTDDRAKGLLKQGLGRVQDAVGGLTGDGKTQAKGKLNEAGGSVQDAFGQAQNKAGDVYEEVESYVKDQPAIALGVTLVMGLIIGLVLRGGGKSASRR